MTVNISTQARNDAGDAIVDLLDTGSIKTTGYIEIRTGLIPASPQVLATGILLATLNLSQPAFNSFVNGVALANAIANDTDVDETGIAGWFRIYDRDNNAVIDGVITITNGTGDIEFDNINFVKGGVVAILSLKGTMPQ